MAYGNQAQEYRKNAVLGASPVGLVVMLYDGALRFIEAGRLAMRSKDLTRQNDMLQRAQRIVSELHGTLDREKGGEIATNLSSLYTYVTNALVRANIEDREASLDDAATVLKDLREAWAQIAASAPAAMAPRAVTLREVALAA